MASFLYRKPVGRLFLKLLTRPALSRGVDRFLDTRASRFLIPSVIRGNLLDLSDFRQEDWPSFNAFFVRRLRPGARPVDREPGHLACPCDGLLTVYPIRPDTVMAIKGVRYTVGDLLRDRRLAEAWAGGQCLVFRLTPSHYHRYCYPDSGRKSRNRTVPGILHTVRPYAAEAGPIYRQNSREYTVLRTENFGDMIYMEVGAMLVGRICNYQRGGGRFLRGQEKGRFEFGGSTIILFLRPGAVELRPEIRRASAREQEFPVRLGEALGWRPGSQPESGGAAGQTGPVKISRTGHFKKCNFPL